MTDTFEFTMNNPLTGEQWNIIFDVDHTDRILFNTKHGKEVEFTKVIRCKDCKHSEPWYRDRRRCFLWDEGGISVWDDGFCNYAERKEE